MQSDIKAAFRRLRREVQNMDIDPCRSSSDLAKQRSRLAAIDLMLAQDGEHRDITEAELLEALSKKRYGMWRDRVDVTKARYARVAIPEAVQWANRHLQSYR